MPSHCKTFCTTVVLAVATTVPAYTDESSSDVAFNNGIGQNTESQPENRVEVSYQVALQGGDLNGCTVDVVEALHPREVAPGVFSISSGTFARGRSSGSHPLSVKARW